MNNPERQINGSEIENLPPQQPANPNSVAEILRRNNPNEIAELDQRFSVNKGREVVGNTTNETIIDIKDISRIENKEQVKFLFSEERLKSLGTEEYLELLKKTPGGGRMLTHVTRQGLRDHASTHYHTAGLGEFSSNFTNMLKNDKSLKPNWALSVDENPSEDSLKDFFYFNDLKGKINRLEALDMIYDKIYRGLQWTQSTPEHTDRTTVHFASDVVMSDMYGGETDNEIFFTFPAMFIRSQMKYVRNISNDRKSDFNSHNDLFVRPNNIREGISLDAGFCFIPRNQLVDPNSGSKYTADKQPIQDGEGITSQEYWDEYFKNNPDQKPKHIIYYDSNKYTPTEALNNWLSENNLNNDNGIVIPEEFQFSENKKTEKEMNNTPEGKIVYEKGIALAIKEFPVNEELFATMRDENNNLYDPEFEANLNMSAKKVFGTFTDEEKKQYIRWSRIQRLKEERSEIINTLKEEYPHLSVQLKQLSDSNFDKWKRDVYNKPGWQPSDIDLTIPPPMPSPAVPPPIPPPPPQI